eukprot:CAMPEP_0203933590 /NCGR_PEP_ID=MMETSP0359-20131031/71749_1 /ASSEMBLY_ACC=CAM_ASM_000338 /TAXON_ID=268821 /ORGANISM="Scrippsiella Hangoei, Strain SHTV-5" /LENGTH=66 /DNA_ID=CAMNT_0050863197 /DNA_START=1 /DNA_END=198 /DNA_ORIENTATION=-
MARQVGLLVLRHHQDTVPEVLRLSKTPQWLEAGLSGTRIPTRPLPSGVSGKSRCQPIFSSCAPGWK